MKVKLNYKKFLEKIFRLCSTKTFGNDKLFPATVKEIVATGLLSQKKGFKFYTKSDYEKVDYILHKLKIEDLKIKNRNLSGDNNKGCYLQKYGGKT